MRFGVFLSLTFDYFVNILFLIVIIQTGRISVKCIFSIHPFFSFFGPCAGFLFSGRVKVHLTSEISVLFQGFSLILGCFALFGMDTYYPGGFILFFILYDSVHLQPLAYHHKHHGMDHVYVLSKKQ